MTLLIARHPIPAFVALAFALSWGTFFLLQLAQRIGLATPPATVATLGVAAAALLVSRVADGAAFRTLWAARFAPPWGTRAVLVQTLVFVVGGGFIVRSLDVSIGALAVAFVCVGLGGEIGWRGFLAPRLLERHSLWRTHTIIVAIWGTWQLPKLAGLRLDFVLPWLATLVLLALLLTYWVRDHARGYLVPAATVHVASSTLVDGTMARGLGGVETWWEVNALLAALCVWNIREEARRERAASARISSP